MTTHELPRALRAICGHDSRSVDGCLNCEAADAIESAVAAALQAQPAVPAVRYVNAGYLNGFNYSATRTNALSVPVFVRIAATPTAGEAPDRTPDSWIDNPHREHNTRPRPAEHAASPAPAPVPAGDALELAAECKRLAVTFARVIYDNAGKLVQTPFDHYDQHHARMALHAAIDRLAALSARQADSTTSAPSRAE